MTSFGSILTAGYRADGMRAWKQNSVGKTYYFYDGDTLILETDATGTKTAVNTNGPSGLLARTTATRTLLYAFDALGQLSQQVIAGAGTVAATYLFDAWGTRAFSSADTVATSDPYSGYGSSSGYISDWETGLQLLGHRYYDPGTGRFLNRDPVGVMGGMNVYGYTSNSPLLRSDSSGYFFNPIGSCLLGAGPGIVGFIMGLLKGTPIDSNAKASLCSALSGCAIGLIVFAILAATGLEATDLVTGGCIAGAITAILSKIADMLCRQFFECKTPDWGCFLMTSLLTAFSGCISGAWIVFPGSGIGSISRPIGSDPIPIRGSPISTMPTLPTPGSGTAAGIVGGLGNAACSM